MMTEPLRIKICVRNNQFILNEILKFLYYLRKANHFKE